MANYNNVTANILPPSFSFFASLSVYEVTISDNL